MLNEVGKKASVLAIFFEMSKFKHEIFDYS